MVVASPVEATIRLDATYLAEPPPIDPFEGVEPRPARLHYGKTGLMADMDDGRRVVR